MKFAWVTIHTPDMEASQEFYTKLIGLEVVSRFASGPEHDIIFLKDSDGLC